MRLLMSLPLCLALSGCYVVLSGHQSTSGGATTTTTAAATNVNVSAGSARLGASFGAPPAPNASGGQLALSRGPSVLLLLGVVIADVINHLGAPSDAAPRPGTRRASIAETCSCYGWKPDVTPVMAPE